MRRGFDARRRERRDDWDTPEQRLAMAIRSGLVPADVVRAQQVLNNRAARYRIRLATGLLLEHGLREIGADMLTEMGVRETVVLAWKRDVDQQLTYKRERRDPDVLVRGWKRRLPRIAAAAASALWKKALVTTILNHGEALNG